MKKVLIIIHLPRSSPRVEGLVKSLPAFGWEPVILTGASRTTHDLPARIIETPYRDAFGLLGHWLKIDPDKDPGQQLKDRLGVNAKKSLLDFLLTIGGMFLNYPDPNKNWKPFALEAATKLLRDEKFDAIISSSAPVTSHLIAHELKRTFHLPWLADLRDLWSQNHNYTYGPVRRWMDRRLERKTLATADALVTVAEPWAEKLRTLHKHSNVYAVHHGFNSTEVNLPAAPLSKKFTITYTGTIYAKWQHPGKLFATLQELMRSGTIKRENIEIRLYGHKETWLATEIENYGLDDVAKQYGPVDRITSVAMQRESQVLWHLDWDDPREKGVYGGKVFEYLGARRPILSTGGTEGDVVDELLRETGAGIAATSPEAIVNALLKWYREYQTSGSIAFHGKKGLVGKYTQTEMAGRFAKILDSLGSDQ